MYLVRLYASHTRTVVTPATVIHGLARAAISGFILYKYCTLYVWMNEYSCIAVHVT